MRSATIQLRDDAWKLFETSGNGDLESYLQRILEKCVDWFGASSASLFLRRGSTRRYVLAAQAGSESNIPRCASISAGRGIAGLSIESGKPLLVGDPLSHPLLSARVKGRVTGIRSSIVVPLMAAHEGCIGVINLSRGPETADFAQEDVAKVASLAQHISLAVSNARLFAGLEESRVAESAARSKLEGVVQSLGVAVMAFDGRDRLTDINRQAQELLGVPAADWRDALGRVSAKLQEAVLEGLSRARSASFSRSSARDRDHDRSWSVVATSLSDGGVAVVIEETTAQDRNHREMARLARLAEIGQMTAAIAHEIRNPLTGIRSAAQMIASNPEHSLEFAGIIEEEALKLNEICEEFLEFSRPLELRRREFDCGELAARLAERNRPDFEVKGVRLELEIDGEKPTIDGDVLRLEQVMRNLMRNALQACKSGCVVRIVSRPGGFSVEDTGKGMQEADLEKLFTPFFTTKPNGTGLGLCNVRKIIDAHGGKLSVWSQPGIGSKFAVQIGGSE